MKRPISLKDYFFEEINLKLPLFLAKSDKVQVGPILFTYTIFFNKRDAEDVGLGLVMKFKPKRTSKSKRTTANAFSITLSVVGIFKIPLFKSKDEREKFVIRFGPPILYKAIESDIEPLVLRSLLKPAKLPKISFNAIKPKKTAGTFTSKQS
jgi:hypothetical protein